MRRLVAGLPAAGWMAAIFVASAQSTVPDLPGGLSDKAAHAIAYAVLGALAVVGLTSARIQAMTWGVALRAILIAAAYGLTDEWHQSFVPGRTASLADWLADAAGAAIGALAVTAWASRARRPAETRDV